MEGYEQETQKSYKEDYNKNVKTEKQLKCFLFFLFISS